MNRRGATILTRLYSNIRSCRRSHSASCSERHWQIKEEARRSRSGRRLNQNRHRDTDPECFDANCHKRGWISFSG